MSFIVIAIISMFKENKEYSKVVKDDVSVKECFKFALDNKILLYLFLIDFSNAFSFVAIENLYPAYLENIGIQINLIGIFIAVQLLISASTGLFINRIRVHINDKILLYYLPFFRVLVILPIYIIKIPVIVIPVLFTLQFIVFVLYAPIKYSLFQKNIPNKYRATFISLSSQSIAFGAIGFYTFSSIMSIKFSINIIIVCALFITFLLNLYSCSNLSKINAISFFNNKEKIVR